jgi:hypothetical protein
MMMPEVTRASKHGFWLLLGDEELLLPFTEFPWFKDATIKQLCDVDWPSPDHLYWPLLDVDLSVEAVRHPKHFPLASKTAHYSELKKEASAPLGLSG